MAYGVKITGTDGSTTFQVTDTSEDQDNYQVVATGTGSSVNLDASAYGGATGNPRLYFEPIGDVVTADVTNNGKTFNFKRYATTEDGNGNKTNATVTTQSVNWIIIKDTATSPVNSSLGNYGLLIKKSNGATGFDSRRLNSNSSFRLLGVEAPRALSGDDQNVNATVGSGYTNARYVAADNLYYLDLGTSGDVHGFAVYGSPTKFLRHAFYVWIYESSGPPQAKITRYYSSPFPVVYGELR